MIHMYKRPNNVSRNTQLSHEIFQKMWDRMNKCTALECQSRGTRNIDVDRTSRQWRLASKIKNFWRSNALLPVPTSLHISERCWNATRIVECAWHTSAAKVRHLVAFTRTLSCWSFDLCARFFEREGNMTKWFHLGKFVSVCWKYRSWIFAVSCRGHPSGMLKMTLHETVTVLVHNQKSTKAAKSVLLI